MNTWMRRVLLISVLAGVGLSAACGAGNPEGKYRDADGTVTLELTGGKASINFGQIHMDGTYTVDGDKLTIRPTTGDTSQTMVLTINKDGSLQGPQGSMITRLEKAK
jgi:hypothetical protein